MNLPVDQNVVHLNTDVLVASQSIGHRLEVAFKTAGCIRFRTTDFPGGRKVFWRYVTENIMAQRKVLKD